MRTLILPGSTHGAKEALKEFSAMIGLGGGRFTQDSQHI
jgi:hypothetical protein